MRGRSTCGRTRDAGSPARARRWVSADHLGDPVPCPLRHPDPAGEWEEISGDHVDSRRRDDGRRRRVVDAREALAPAHPHGVSPRSDAARLSRKVDDGDATGSSTSVDPQELPRGVRSILAALVRRARPRQRHPNGARCPGHRPSGACEGLVEQRPAGVRDPRDSPPATDPQRRSVRLEIEDGRALRQPDLPHDSVQSGIDLVDVPDARLVGMALRVDVGSADPDSLRRRGDTGAVGLRCADDRDDPAVARIDAQDAGETAARRCSDDPERPERRDELRRVNRKPKPADDATGAPFTATMEPPASVAPVRGSCRPARATQSVRTASKMCIGRRVSATRKAIVASAGLRQDAVDVDASARTAPAHAAASASARTKRREPNCFTRVPCLCRSFIHPTALAGSLRSREGGGGGSCCATPRFSWATTGTY